MPMPILFKVNMVLIVMLVICALGVVTVQHKMRAQHIALEHEKNLARKLDIEWGKLQLEQSTLIVRRQIEQAAKTQLDMEVPNADRIQIISAKKIDGSRWVIRDDSAQD